MICSSSAIAQQLGRPQVGQAAEPQADAERDDLADQAAAERVVEQVPDAEADRGERRGGDRDPDRGVEQPAQLEAAELAAQDHRLGDDRGGGADRRSPATIPPTPKGL